MPEGGTSVTPATGSGSEGGNDESGFDPPQPECGNGYVEADEECDDGNAIEDDACNSSCQVPCGLEWSEVVLGPTLDSLIEGRAITSDPTGQVILSGLLREITVAMDGTTTVADDAVRLDLADPCCGRDRCRE